MSQEREVKYKFGADASEVTNAVKGMEASLKSLESALHAVEGGLALGAIKGAFGSMLDAISEAETAQARFANTMAATGQAADPKKFHEFAEAIQRVTTFQADEVEMAGVMLGRFKLTQDQIQTMMPGVVDLAAHMGVGLAGAADSAGRAVEHGSYALRGLHMSFSKAEMAAFDAATQLERIHMIQAKVQGSIGGTAALMANTASGAAKQYANAVNDLEETLGKLIQGPAIEGFHRMRDAVASVSEAIADLPPLAKDGLGAVMTGLGGLAVATGGLLAFAGALGTVKNLWPTVLQGFKSMRLLTMEILAPIAAIAAGILGAILIVGAFKQAWDGDLGGMRTFITDWVRDVKYLFAELVDFMQSSWEGFGQYFRDVWTRAKGMLSGKSMVQIEAEVAAAHANAPQNPRWVDKLKEATDQLAVNGRVLGEAIKMGAGDLLDSGKSVLKDVKSVLDSGLGVIGGVVQDAADAMGWIETVDPEIVKDDDGKKGHRDPAKPYGFTLQDLMGGKPLNAGLESDSRKTAQSLSKNFGAGEDAAKMASEFLEDMRKAFGVSKEVLTAVVEASKGNVTDIQDTARTLSGFSRDAQAQILDMANGSKANIDKLAFAFQDVSAAGIDALRRAGGDDINKVAELSNQLYVQWQESLQLAKEAAARAKTDIEEGKGVTSAGKTGQNDGDRKDGLTGADLVMDSAADLGRGMGKGGAIISGAIQGGQAGGPMGAVAGAVTALLMETKGFQRMITQLSGIVAPMVTACEPLIEALEPLMGALQVIGKLFVTLMNALSPLMPVIRLLCDFVTGIVMAIAWVVNGVLSLIAGIMHALGDILDWFGVGGALHRYADSLEANMVKFDDVNSETRDANGRAVEEANNRNTQATQENTEAINASIANAPSGWVVTAARYQSTIAGLGDPNAPEAPPAPTYQLPNATKDDIIRGGGVHTRPANNVTVNIMANDANDVYAKFKQLMARESFNSTGTSVKAGAPFSTPRNL